MQTIKLPSGKIFSREFLETVLWVDSITTHEEVKEWEGKGELKKTKFFQWSFFYQPISMGTVDYFKIRYNNHTDAIVDRNEFINMWQKIGES